ncbi:MAG: hypothetical protein M3083_18330 [Actinomycetota bacterium]|nr:hypothetical protein [Actinomycetota bacterium]
MTEGTAPASPLPPGYESLNRYTSIIVDEALSRGIEVEIVSPALGELRLSFGGRSMTTYESLSELTSAVAFRRCDDKILTRKVLERAGLAVPAGREATFDGEDLEFLHEYRSIVVKPSRGEQGWGITVGVRTEDELYEARDVARNTWPIVLLEEQRVGDDVRAIVIGGEVVAAAVRRPATVTGDGSLTIAELVEQADKRRRAATNGAARIPLDEGVSKLARAAGFGLDSVLPAGHDLVVGRTANVHTGATIDDVTEELHPALADLAVAVSAAIDVPVAGVDLIVDSVDKPDGTVIEVNEQPGLANHEPRPTAERFVDLLFPDTKRD